MSYRRNVACKRTPPNGFTMIESLLALAFLAFAASVALKTHQARLDFDRNAMDRLANQLKIENIAERLSLIPYEDISDKTKQLNQEDGLTAKIDSFETEDRSGWHVQISLNSDGHAMTRHLWKLEPAS